LIGVEETAHGRAIIQLHIPGDCLGLGSGSYTGSRAAFSQHLAFDRPLPPDSPPQLPLGIAVRFQHRLGHIPQEVIGTLPVLDQSPMHIGQRSYCSDHANDARVILASISFKMQQGSFW
jgi:hypothetical protein